MGGVRRRRPRPPAAEPCAEQPRGHLGVEGGDDELGGVAVARGLPAQHPGHSGPARQRAARQKAPQTRQAAPGWHRVRMRAAGEGRRQARQRRWPPRRHNQGPYAACPSALPPGPHTCTAGPARRRSRQTGRRGPGRSPAGRGVWAAMDQTRWSSRRRRRCGRERDIEGGQAACTTATEGQACRLASAWAGWRAGWARHRTWMAKMRASATSVFCPPLSCFMDMVSPPPKDTCAVGKSGQTRQEACRLEASTGRGPPS